MRHDVRTLRAVLAIVVLVALVIGCGTPESITSPSAPATDEAPRIDPSAVKPSTTYTIGFSSLRENHAPFTIHAESGFRVSVVSADWMSLTTYGNPQPFIEFYGPAGVTTTGEVRITVVATNGRCWRNHRRNGHAARANAAPSSCRLVEQ